LYFCQFLAEENGLLNIIADEKSEITAAVSVVKQLHVLVVTKSAWAVQDNRMCLLL
jgi:hypothetical protein